MLRYAFCLFERTPLAGLCLLALLSSCGTERTVSEVKGGLRSRLYENTMGVDFGDFSKRSQFDALHYENSGSTLTRKSFPALESRVQEQTFMTETSRIGEQHFAVDEGAADRKFSGASAYRGKRARQEGRNYPGAAKDFARSQVPERFRKSADRAAKNYDSSSGRLVESWNADSLPPRIVQTPDSDAELSSLQSEDGLRATLGK